MSSSTLFLPTSNSSRTASSLRMSSSRRSINSNHSSRTSSSNCSASEGSRTRFQPTMASNNKTSKTEPKLTSAALSSLEMSDSDGAVYTTTTPQSMPLSSSATLSKLRFGMMMASSQQASTMAVLDDTEREEENGLAGLSTSSQTSVPTSNRQSMRTLMATTQYCSTRAFADTDVDHSL